MKILNNGENSLLSIKIDLDEEKYNKFSNDELNKLISKYQESNDPLIKKELINRNLKLVLSLIMKNFTNLMITKKLDVNYLLNVGVIGLIQALDHYDETKGGSFSTIAYYYIKRSIYNEFYSVLSNNIGGATSACRYYYTIRKKRFDGKTDEEIRKEMNISKSVFDNAVENGSRAYDSFSLNNQSNENPHCYTTFEDLLEDEEIIDTKLEYKELKHCIEKIFDDEFIFPNTKSGNKSKNCFYLYYYKEYTYDRIAKEYNCSKQGIESLMKRAMNRIKQKYSKELLIFLVN